jgi:hypothetical protein
VDKAENINTSPNFYSYPQVDILMILHLPNFFGSIVAIDEYIYIYLYIHLEYNIFFEGNCAITAELPKISINREV